MTDFINDPDDRYTGRQLYVEWKGEQIQLYRSFEVSEEGNVVEAGAGADTEEIDLPDTVNRTTTLTVVDDVDHTIFDLFEVFEVDTLIWGPRGNAAGRRKRSARARVNSRTNPFEYNGTVTFTVNIKFLEPIMNGTFN